MTVSVWQANGNQEHIFTEVAVIGAGLLGCAAAIFLKQAGKQVVIIEGRDVGLGASSRNAGFMLTGLDKYYHQAETAYGAIATRDIWKLSQHTHTFWKKIIKKYNVPHEPCGSLLLAETAEEVADLKFAAERMNSEGFECEFLPYDPLDRGYLAAIRQPSDGSLQPYDLAQALFKESGARLIENSEVYALEAAKDEIRVKSRKAIVHAQKVLLCTNAYSRDIDPFFVGKVLPVRAQCLATAPLPERIINAIGYSDYGYMYYRDLPDGGLLLGGGRKQNVQLENDTTEDRINAPVQDILEAYLQKHFPDVLEHAPIVRRWSGIMAFTPDGLPLIGSLPQDSRIAFAIGCHGHGLSLGAGVAELAVDFLLNGKKPPYFDVERL